MSEEAPPSKKTKTMFPKLTLTYFGMGGRAEHIRWALAVGKIPFSHKAVEYNAFMETKDKLYPLGALPILEVDGMVIPQSVAILRYVGRMAGLYPTDPLEALKVDSIIYTIDDLEKPLDITFSGPVHTLIAEKEWSKEEKLAMRKRIREKAIPKYLGYAEKQLVENGTGFMVGQSLTIADLKMDYVCGQMIQAGKLDGIPPETLEDFPKITECLTKIRDVPEIKKFIDQYKGKYGDFDYEP